jgi:hypothetical protein
MTAIAEDAPARPWSIARVLVGAFQERGTSLRQHISEGIGLVVVVDLF